MTPPTTHTVIPKLQAHFWRDVCYSKHVLWHINVIPRLPVISILWGGGGAEHSRVPVAQTAVVRSMTPLICSKVERMEGRREGGCIGVREGGSGAQRLPQNRLVARHNLSCACRNSHVLILDQERHVTMSTCQSSHHPTEQTI